MLDVIKKLNAIFEKKEKKRFAVLLIMMLIAAILETVSVGLIVPFINIVTDPNVLEENPIINNLYVLFGFSSFNHFVIISACALIGFFLIKNMYLLFFLRAQYKLLFEMQAQMSTQIFNNYMYRSYAFHLNQNSAHLLRNTTTVVQNFYNRMIKSILHFSIEVLTMVFIFILLVILAPGPALISTFVMLISGGIFYSFFNKRIQQAGKDEQEHTANIIKWANQGFGAIKDVKVLGREDFFIKKYYSENKSLSKLLVFYNIIKQVPKFFIELLVVITILVIIIFIMISTGDYTKIISITSLFAVAAFKIAPSFNKIASAITTVKNSYPTLNIIYEDLALNRLEKIDILDKCTKKNIDDKKTFNKSLILTNVFFRYENSDLDVLKSVNIEIPKGASIAIVGPSGAGKTTLVDIILGLLNPCQGTIEIDGNNIRRERQKLTNLIGYIPQYIYLSDDTIINNVAFGIPANQIDQSAFFEAINKAQMKEFVFGLPDKEQTIIGERGVRLSGGQRQRIGIARALYHNPEILFLDEATSALDNKTEYEVMQAINSLKGNVTLVIIAHRLSTIENCDVVYNVEDGRVNKVADNRTGVNNAY